jgi:sec-independent protein translocase protein TatA
MGFSIPHLIVVLVIVLLVFGTKRLKNLGEDLGGAINSFRKAIKESDKSQTLTEHDDDLEHKS